MIMKLMLMVGIRPETEAYTTHLATLVRNATLHPFLEQRKGNGLRILDVCSGSGCIGLLLL